MRHFRSSLLLFVLVLFSHSAPLFSKDHNKRKPTPPPPAPITQFVEYSGPTNQSEKQLVEHVKQSIVRAENRNSKLNRAVLQISGMSSPKVRHLLNNLCSLPSTVYLEIGCWQGSTWIASLFGNEASISAATAIDNWSGFGGPQQQFLQNCRTFLPSLDYKLFSEDSFNSIPIQSSIDLSPFTFMMAIIQQKAKSSHSPTITPSWIISLLPLWMIGIGPQFNKALEKPLAS